MEKRIKLLSLAAKQKVFLVTNQEIISFLASTIFCQTKNETFCFVKNSSQVEKVFVRVRKCLPCNIGREVLIIFFCEQILECSTFHCSKFQKSSSTTLLGPTLLALVKDKKQARRRHPVFWNQVQLMFQLFLDQQTWMKSFIVVSCLSITEKK